MYWVLSIVQVHGHLCCRGASIWTYVYDIALNERILILASDTYCSSGTYTHTISTSAVNLQLNIGLVSERDLLMKRSIKTKQNTCTWSIRHVCLSRLTCLGHDVLYFGQYIWCSCYSCLTRVFLHVSYELSDVECCSCALLHLATCPRPFIPSSATSYIVLEHYFVPHVIGKLLTAVQPLLWRKLYIRRLSRSKTLNMFKKKRVNARVSNHLLVHILYMKSMPETHISQTTFLPNH